MPNYPHRFDEAMKAVFKHEGGLVDHPNDPGGWTNFGVSLRFLKSVGYDVNQDGVVDYRDIQVMTKKEAKKIYYTYFWKRCHKELGPLTAIKLFDIGINCGVSRASKLLQQTLCELGRCVAVDGKIGKRTLKAAKALDDKVLCITLSRHQEAFYVGLVYKKPALRVFLRGWQKRASWLPKHTNRPRQKNPKKQSQ